MSVCMFRVSNSIMLRDGYFWKLLVPKKSRIYTPTHKTPSEIDQIPFHQV